MRYRLNSDGTKTPVAGRGKAEYGASTIRKGTYTIDEIAPGGALWKTFTFSDPMPDGDYMVDFSFPATASIYAQAYEKNASNVKVSFRNISTNDTFTNIVVNYTCYKLYTDTEYNGLLNNQRYSTSEIDTGKTWIDGKKIYRRVFTGTVGSAIDVQTIFLYSGGDIDELIAQGGNQKWVSGTTIGYVPIPYAWIKTNSNVEQTMCVFAQNGTLIYRAVIDTACAGQPYHIWVEYTKS